MKLLEVGAEPDLDPVGPAFRASIPRSSITGVRVVRPSRWAGIGAHWWGGAWVVNTRFGDAVELTTAGSVPVRVLGVPVRGRRFQVVVDDPTAIERQLLVR